MPVDNDWVVACFDGFGDEDVGEDLVSVGFFVGFCQNLEIRVCCHFDMKLLPKRSFIGT